MGGCPVSTGHPLADQVYAAVNADVLYGRLPPGHRLKIADIAGKHGVSTGVVREACPGSRAAQLIRAEPQ
jgi:DNA-binding GntR family transcriptional regulator